MAGASFAEGTFAEAVLGEGGLQAAAEAAGVGMLTESFVTEAAKESSAPKAE